VGIKLRQKLAQADATAVPNQRHQAATKIVRLYLPGSAQKMEMLALPNVVDGSLLSNQKAQTLRCQEAGLVAVGQQVA
jgi:hypothetical protein